MRFLAPFFGVSDWRSGNGGLSVAANQDGQLRRSTECDGSLPGVPLCVLYDTGHKCNIAQPTQLKVVLYNIFNLLSSRQATKSCWRTGFRRPRFRICALRIPE
jgi:hypothetical protein